MAYPRLSTLSGLSASSPPPSRSSWWRSRVSRRFIAVRPAAPHRASTVARLRSSTSRGCMRDSRAARSTCEARRTFSARCRPGLEPPGAVVEQLLRRGERQPRIAHAPRQIRLHPMLVRQPATQRAHQARRLLAEKTPAGHAIRHDHLGGLRRGGRARVGDEVGQGHVDLVPHGAHHRHAAGGDGAHQRLVVEAGQIVRRSAAAADDDDVDLVHPGERVPAPAGSTPPRPPLAPAPAPAGCARRRDGRPPCTRRG